MRLGMGEAVEVIRHSYELGVRFFDTAYFYGDLKTERVELIQCHNVSTREDFERVLGPGGAHEVLIKAKAEGRLRSIGFSSHNPDIAVRGCNSDKFDTLQFPFHFIEHDACIF